MTERDETPWTPRAIKALRRLAGRLSAEQIGNRLGRTKNAIIGKAHRLGVDLPRIRRQKLSTGKTATAMAKPLKPPRQTKLLRADAQLPRGAQRLVEPPPPIVLPLEMRSGAGKAIAALTPSHCRWPMGSPANDDFAFCSEPVAAYGFRYCREHQKISTRQGSA